MFFLKSKKTLIEGLGANFDSPRGHYIEAITCLILGAPRTVAKGIANKSLSILSKSITILIKGNQELKARKTAFL